MKIFCKIFGKTFSNRRTAIQNGLSGMFRATYHADIKPIKMAFNVFNSNATSPKLPPLIIMHGLFGSKQNWRGISKGLEKTTKRKIYSVDARNHGDSPHVDAHSSGHMAADIGFLIKQENLQRVSLMGHSMGGRSMMYFVMKFPKLVEKTIIVDISPISLPKNAEALEEIFYAMKNVKVSPKLSMAEGRASAESQMLKFVREPETVNFIIMNLKKLDTGEFVWRTNINALQANFQNFRITQNFSNVPPHTGPVLFICGEHSNYMNKSDWPQIKEIFPKAEIKWLDSGHLVHFEQPEEFIHVVTQFLK